MACASHVLGALEYNLPPLASLGGCRILGRNPWISGPKTERRTPLRRQYFSNRRRWVKLYTRRLRGRALHGKILRFSE
jgi:hypothetical protein